MVSLWAIAGFLRPGYDQLAQKGSELGTGPNSIVMNTNFVVTGTLMMIFASGLKRKLGRSSWSRIGVAFFLISGILEAATGLFPCDPGCPLSLGSLSQNVHLGIAIVFFFSIAVTPLFVGLGFSRDGFWQSYYSYSLITGLGGLGLCIAFLVAVVTSYQYVGLVQRLLLALPFQWIGITANHFLRFANRGR